MNQPLSPTVVEVAQFAVLTTTAIFVGLRFVPVRFRRPIGLALTTAYVIGIVMFSFYVWMG